MIARRSTLGIIVVIIDGRRVIDMDTIIITTITIIIIMVMDIGVGVEVGMRSMRSGREVL